MNIRLTPEHESLTQHKFASGSYATTSEVVREALRLLSERDMLQERRWAELRREIAVGLDDLDHGRVIRCNEQSSKAMFEEIKRKGREAL